jgi:SNF2 family DNA or RNA helicase
MMKKYNNLLYNCDELLTFVLNYIQDKYGMTQNENKDWEVSVGSLIATIQKIFSKIRESLIEEIVKLELKKNENKIQEETQEPVKTVEEQKQELAKKFESFSDREIIQTLLEKDSKNKLALVALELLEFKKRDASQKVPLQSLPIVKNLMRIEMKRDKEHVRLSQEFKIFREMTEKSILRTIYFYHKRDSSPYEWRKFDPGVMDYTWTGSQDPSNFKVVFEEEFENEEDVEEVLPGETGDLDIEQGPEPVFKKPELPTTELEKDPQMNGQCSSDSKVKLEVINPNGSENGNTSMKIVLKPVNGKLDVKTQNDPQEDTGTKFKFTLRKNPKLDEKPQLETQNNIEEECGVVGKGIQIEGEEREKSGVKEESPLPELKPIGKGLVSLNNENSNFSNSSPVEQNKELSVNETESRPNVLPSLLNFIDTESIEFMNNTYLKMTGKIPKLYLIKWKNMSYNQCTWESTLNLENISLKIEDFQKHNRALDKDHRSQALDKKRSHRRVLEAMERAGFQRRSGGFHSVFNDYYRVLYREMNSDTKLNMNVIRSLNNTFKGQRALKKYQIESLMWMIERRRKRKNFILADEMGLGKTIQSMAFCLFLKAIEKLDGPFMIVAPLSTLPHWKKTFEEWTSLNVILYHDNESKRGRKRCRDLEWYQKDIRLTGEFSSDSKICKFHVIITSFEVFSQDVSEFVDNLCIQHIIIDEAHRLKNQNAKVIKVFQRLPCKRISLLTGTPIQNNINELWSLLNFIEPGRFNDQYEFERNFKDIRSKEQLMHLKQILEPYMIRRMKNEVETIPPLEETLLEIDLTNFQKVSYKTLYEKNKGTLERGRGLGYLTSMNNLEMQLRKCCNHPFLIREIHDKVSSEVYTQNDYVQKMLDYSSKMIVLDKLITKYKKEHKKMLIFSQFTEMLKLIEEFLGFRKILYKKIDGATKARDRQNAIEAFNSNPDVFEIFLLSTKAGGLGINLTSANVVLIYDSDWNPQNDVQAIARAHRIGQKAEVKVYRLISKMTYEAEMYRRASKKLGLDQAVFLSNQNDTSNTHRKPGGHTPSGQSRSIS